MPDDLDVGSRHICSQVCFVYSLLVLVIFLVCLFVFGNGVLVFVCPVLFLVDCLFQHVCSARLLYVSVVLPVAGFSRLHVCVS